MIKLKSVLAHCDAPCGVYETDSLMHAAQTCLALTDKIAALDKTDADYDNQLIRLVMQKDNQAQKCKQELYILWSDYFKPADLDKYPNLHDKFWWATKQCSAVRQGSQVEAVNKLIDMVKEIVQMFADSQQA